MTTRYVSYSTYFTLGCPLSWGQYYSVPKLTLSFSIHLCKRQPAVIFSESSFYCQARNISTTVQWSISYLCHWFLQFFEVMQLVRQLFLSLMQGQLTLFDSWKYCQKPLSTNYLARWTLTMTLTVCSVHCSHNFFIKKNLSTDFNDWKNTLSYFSPWVSGGDGLIRSMFAKCDNRTLKITN